MCGVKSCHDGVLKESEVWLVLVMAFVSVSELALVLGSV